MGKIDFLGPLLIPAGIFIILACLGALISYPLYLQFDGSYSLEKISSKMTLLFLVISIYPLSRFCGFNLSSLGFNCGKSHFFFRLTIGFIWGIIILFDPLLAEIYFGIRVFDETFSFSLSTLINLIALSLTSGLLIAIIEETLFRGLLFKFIKSRSTSSYAIVISALFYATLHFLQSDITTNPADTTVLTSLKVVVSAFSNLANPQIADSFIALFLVGVLLAIVRNHTNSIAYCIGLHASWVFLIKITKAVTDNNHLSEWSWLTGHYDGIIGYLVSGWLGIVILLYLVYLNKTGQKNPSRNVANPD